MYAPTLDRAAGAAGDVQRRLLVTRRIDGLYRSIGFLDELSDGTYSFEYLAESVQADWFVPLPGLRDTDRRHVGEALFPIFASRVIGDTRPDHDSTLRTLDLPTGATPFEILERSGGRRVGDSIEVLPVPVPSPSGEILLQFFVHGVRHAVPEAQEAIAYLRPRQVLDLEHEPANPADPLAICVKGRQMTLGYVPAPLTRIISSVMAGSEPQLRVVRANGPEVGFHFRLLVELAAVMDPSDEPPFQGREWTTQPELQQRSH